MQNLPNDRYKLAFPHDQVFHCPKCDHVLDDEGICNYCGWDIEVEESEGEIL